MADDSLPPGTELTRDEQGNVRRISHARAPYQPPGFVPAGPTSLANWYLQEFGYLFGMDESWLEGDPYGLNLAGDKAGRDTTVVSYSETYNGLPVFLAGVSVRMRSDLLAVISSQSTLHLDIELGMQYTGAAKEDAEKISATQLKKMLGLPAKGKLPEIRSVRLVIYRYLSEARLDPAFYEPDQPTSAPRLDLPEVPDSIETGKHYVVRDVLFALDLPDWGLLEWRALIEVETDVVLYLRAFVESCTGAVFRDDPITMSGDPTNNPCAPLVSLNSFSEVVPLQGLIVANPQTLSGEYVELVDTNNPPIAPPTAANPPCDFTFPATSDDFSAVNAYYHMDAQYRMVDEMGFTNYFAGTTFPIPVDHRGAGGAVNAFHSGSLSGTTKFRFGLAQAGCPVGYACDRRVVIHEFGHSVLRNHIDSGVFTFAHGVGDSMAVIMSDPRSQAPDRFDRSPFSSNDRRHDRDVAAGWGWGGTRDTGSYASTQILSTTLFRAYRSLGGDAAELAEREFAARFVTFLILAAVESCTPVTQPLGPEDFAEDIIDSDLATSEFDGHPGGAFHKVIRWAFEKQDAYGGLPPEVDVYIDDGRSGEYPWLENFTNKSEIWTRYEPDGGTVHQSPLVGTLAHVYVRVRNRGTDEATEVKVKAFTGPPGGTAIWPDQFSPLPTAELSFPDPIPAGGSVVVGPFEWTPKTTKGASIIMSTSTAQDTSNSDTVTESLQTRRIVPFDNNIAQLNLPVIRYPVHYSVKFACGLSDGGPVAPGQYYTAINIHNPTEKPVKFRKKVVVALPGEKAGLVTKFTFNRLGPNEALEIDCPDIYGHVGLPEGCFIKGFVVIESLVELDVVAVYTAAGADKHVETMDIEYVTPRIWPPEEEPEEPEEPEELDPRLPDLIPRPPFPPPQTHKPHRLPQLYCLSLEGDNRADTVRIEVHNQGAADAPHSVTDVKFENNPAVHLPTPPITAGDKATVETGIPRACYTGEPGCSFEIIVNATHAFDESDMTNNTASGRCPGYESQVDS